MPNTKVTGVSRPKIVLTGGHAATTALATIQALTRYDRRKYRIYWIGSKGAVEGRKVKGLETEIFPQFGVTLHKITAGRIQRRFSIYTLPSLAKIPFGFLHALTLLLRIRPNIVLSFGGYAAFPVVVGAFFLGIPVIVHEQTIAVGLANKLSGFFARKVALARSESQKFFAEEKTVLTGNPLMEELSNLTPKSKIGTPAVLFITGGSRGAQVINKAVDEILPSLVKEFRVIHQTGELDFKHFKEKKLPHYSAFATIEPLSMAQIYQSADILVGRAGANTVSEVIAIGPPSILIPIPWSRYDEQNKNAQFAAQCGIATVINQDDLTGETLEKRIFETRKNWSEIVKQADRKTAELDKGAAQSLVKLVEEYLN